MDEFGIKTKDTSNVQPNRSFWDQLLADITSSTPEHGRVFAVLSEIKASIINLADQEFVKSQIAEIIDEKHIHNQLRSKTFDFMDCGSLCRNVVNVLLGMQTRMAILDRKAETEASSLSLSLFLMNVFD